jgi:hypothetical protein
VVRLHADVWQLSLAVHGLGVSTHSPVVRLHADVWQLSLAVHVFGVSTHRPLFRSQVDVWQLSLGVHATGVLWVQVPALQESPVVHLLPSSHAVPSVLLGFEQLPVAESQVPTAWHWSLAVHVFVVPPEHEPAWQVSPVVHLLPSSQVVPSVLFGLEH